jgi:thiamine biosynthesis lipoprotein
MTVDAGVGTTVERPRTVHVEHCMGTVFTIDIRDAGSWTDAIGKVVAGLRRVDAVFSTYRPDSDICRLRRGELVVEEADPHMPEVLDLCEQMQRETGGYFSSLWNGQLDPTGLVKGWAIEQASHLLAAHGSRNHVVNGGGDIQTAGGAAPGQHWRVGITDPLDRGRVLTVVAGRDIAVATSGVAERGVHIINPYTGTAADDLASVTIVGRALTRVDSYATAAFAMGTDALPWVEALPGYEALVVTSGGVSRCTSGFRSMARP